MMVTAATLEAVGITHRAEMAAAVVEDRTTTTVTTAITITRKNNAALPVARVTGSLNTVTDSKMSPVAIKWGTKSKRVIALRAVAELALNPTLGTETLETELLEIKLRTTKLTAAATRTTSPRTNSLVLERAGPKAAQFFEFSF